MSIGRALITDAAALWWCNTAESRIIEKKCDR
jgi:hypothetical protein